MFKTLVSIVIMLLLIDLVMSNQGTVIVGLWPFDTRFEISVGFAFILVFIFAFLAGGFYMWITACKDLKTRLKFSKQQVKDIEKQIKGFDKY